MKPIPQEIKAADGQISVQWSDGHQAQYNARELRLACRCAACVDEWTHEKSALLAHVPHRIEVKAIDMIGQYALHFSWSDGHNTGIYSYDYLREICGCGSCREGSHFDV